jgi:hypothetical protein
MLWWRAGLSYPRPAAHPEARVHPVKFWHYRVPRAADGGRAKTETGPACVGGTAATSSANRQQSFRVVNL